MVFVYFISKQILPQPLATDPAPYDDLYLDSGDPLVMAEAEAAAAARAGVDNSDRAIVRTPTITPSSSGPKGLFVNQCTTILLF